MKKAGYIVGGIFFTLIALTLFTGLYLNYPIIGVNTPSYFWPNLFAFIICTFISIWMFRTATRA